MEMKDLAKLSEAQLHDKLAELRKDYADAKKSNAAGELANPRVLTHTRQAIARVKTLIAAAVAANKRKDGDNA